MEVRRCGNCKSFMRDPHAAILGACSTKFKRGNGEFTYDLVDSYDQPCALYEQKAFDGLTLPRDMEWLLEVWPKWSNGEYCKFGDWWKADEYGEDEPQQLRKIAIYSPDQLREWGQDEGENYGYEWDFVRPRSTTYRPDKVEPPAPKAVLPKAVFGSDDEEIQIGDTVYLDDEHASNAESSLIGRGTNYGLCGIEPNDALVVTRFFDDCVGFTKHNAWCPASWLTHKKPVIAADGERLRVGETVYEVDTGKRFFVTRVFDGMTEPDFPEHTIECRKYEDVVAHIFKPEQLTHELPDSWERLEADAKAWVNPTMEERAEIVHRAKKLAGVE